ncbi:HDIG domain-containing metalloprotein [Mastigocoleus sp. MO_188.B34]|uniref:HD family phosphohydrolase n=1 Tax=Mastigocoleus sp. MO_188.B34 TaxID=3036635 RepID=UPI002625F6D7|nr:HDIG domain-containing metalloprotein [Mastigocoleus sp. MO_188.B34]MDJ0692822.1 HDIG domain-containing protein [Mastigocoleus sp. MO_188.B34]
MKTQSFIRSLSQQLNCWERRYKALRRLYLSKVNEKGKYKIVKISNNNAKSLKSKNGSYALGMSCVPEHSSTVFVIAVVLLTGVMGQKFYNQPQLKMGAIAPKTIYAPRTANIEDKKETRILRKIATQDSLPVLMVDREIDDKIKQSLNKNLNQFNEIRDTLGSFPYLDSLLLKIPNQRYLRSAPEQEWKALLIAIDAREYYLRIMLPSSQNDSEAIDAGNLESKNNEDNKKSQASNYSQKPNFVSSVKELNNYRSKNSTKNLYLLLDKIIRARKQFVIAKQKAHIQKIIDNENIFLEISDKQWEQAQIGINRSLNRILTQGISPGIPSQIVRDTVRLQVEGVVPKNAEELAIKLLLDVLKPNLKKDEEKTRLRAQQAADRIEPVVRTVKKGEFVIRKGKEISEWDFEVLEHYKLNRREVNWLGLAGVATTVTITVGIFAVVERRIKYRMRQSDRLLVLLLTLSTPVFIILGTPYTTWSGVGLLLGGFYGPVLGVTTLGLLLFLIPLSLEVSKVALLAGAAGGILASCFAKRLRCREELALLGIAIALTEGGVFLIVRLLVSAAYGSAGYFVLQEAALFALSGLAWSIVALGLSPYLEKIFDLVTPIRLAELANPNRPLLKRLATEAPGTFQHTLLVATLAEAAAKQLKCDVELVRAGTLYHDIGKMHDPQGFIENQMGEPNKHETEIQDPWQSAQIIKKHVTEGLVMARKHSLPSAIQSFIPEHQGNMLIAYFHHQAQQIAQENPQIEVKESDFRYDGPIPQSRETGIVMLADSCEAALRSLKDATPEQALIMVNNILRARWKDNQLVDSGLSRQDLSRIAEIFVEVWQQFHHKRIAYPKSKIATQKSGKA